MSRPPPSAITDLLPPLHNVRPKGQHEWSAACPFCTPSDRIYKSDRLLIWDDYPKGPRWWCRVCKRGGDAESVVEGIHPEPVEIRPVEINREIIDCYTTFHDRLIPETRELWREKGISDVGQDRWFLGFTLVVPEYEWTGPGLSIPYIGKDGECKTIQYKLVKPHGKMRYTNTRHIIPPVFWASHPERNSGPLLVVEGAIKGMVVTEYLEAAGYDMTIAAVHSATPGEAVWIQLRDSGFDPIYLMLDPDALVPRPKQAVSDAAKAGLILGDRSRYVSLLGKPDDMLLSKVMTADRLVQRYILGATLHAP